LAGPRAESLWKRGPGPLDQLSTLIDQHNRADHAPEQAFLALNATGHKVCATAAVIVPPQSNRSSVVDSGIVSHLLPHSTSRARPGPAAALRAGAAS
jgi:hypothetical protein